MNKHVEKRFFNPKDPTEMPKAIERRATPQEPRRAELIHTYAQDRVTMRENDAKKIVKLVQRIQSETERTSPMEHTSDTVSSKDTAKSLGLLDRFNHWLKGIGRPEQSSLSQSAYDKTQTIAAKTVREEARDASVELIANQALRANIEALAHERDALVRVQEQASQASFLTRWRYHARARELQNQIRFREASIQARRAQLKQPSEQTTDGSEDQPQAA